MLVAALIAGEGLFATTQAATPPVLAKALELWMAGQEDLAFTQRSRVYLDNGTLKEERLERYDPSLPDSQRWRLIEVDGHPASATERHKWEAKKNGKPRKKTLKSPAEYLDLEHARPAGETPKAARYDIELRPEAARLLAVENIAVRVTVDKESGGIVAIAAKLRQPFKVLMGLARITGLDIDVELEPTDEDAPRQSGEVKTSSTAHVAMSRLGSPMEYNWSDFKRVMSYRAPEPARK